MNRKWHNEDEPEPTTDGEPDGGTSEPGPDAE